MPATKQAKLMTDSMKSKIFEFKVMLGTKLKDETLNLSHLEMKELLNCERIRTYEIRQEEWSNISVDWLLAALWKTGLKVNVTIER